MPMIVLPKAGLLRPLHLFHGIQTEASSLWLVELSIYFTRLVWVPDANAPARVPGRGALYILLRPP